MKREIVKLGDGQEAVVLVPKIEGELAIVHLPTLKRLASLLPNVDFRTIKANIIADLEGAHNLEEVISILENEISFHKSVNLIQSYKPEPAEAMESLS